MYTNPLNHKSARCSSGVRIPPSSNLLSACDEKVWRYTSDESHGTSSSQDENTHTCSWPGSPIEVLLPVRHGGSADHREHNTGVTPRPNSSKQLKDPGCTCVKVYTCPLNELNHKSALTCGSVDMCSPSQSTCRCEPKIKASSRTPATTWYGTTAVFGF